MTKKIYGMLLTEIELKPGDISGDAWNIWINSTFVLYKRISDDQLLLASNDREKPEIKIQDMNDLDEFLLTCCSDIDDI